MRTLIGLLMAVATTAGAQYPPKAVTNLKVFPPDISVDSVLETMAGFTRALGVRCTYCHAGREGQPLEFDRLRLGRAAGQREGPGHAPHGGRDQQ